MLFRSAIKEEAAQLLSTFIDLLSTIQPKLSVFPTLLKDTDMYPTRMDFQTTADIVRKVLDIPELTPGLLTASSLSETLDEYREVSARGRKRDEIKATVETGFTKEILEINATQMLAEWNRVSAQWFLPR